MERLLVNSKGRTFIKSCALSHDLRTLIVDEIFRNGGDINTANFPCKFSDVANAVSGNIVKNVWQYLHAERTLNHGGMEEQTPLI